MKQLTKSGIYSIINKITGFRYVGGSINIPKRFSQHKDDLKNNKHDNAYLQNAWNKYWSVSFEFEVLEYCEKEKLIEREQFWIDSLSTVRPDGYNLKSNASSNLGIVFGPQARANMSASRKANLNMDHIKRMSAIAANLSRGKPRTEEIKLKMSIAQKGKKLTAEHKEKVSISNREFDKRRRAANIVGIMGMSL
jgi:group I intron endonuclease